MRHLIHSSVLLALLACTACSQASDRAPTTLDGVGAQLSTLQEGAHATDGQVARLTWWLLAVLAVNLVVLAAVLLRRRQA